MKRKNKKIKFFLIAAILLVAVFMYLYLTNPVNDNEVNIKQSENENKIKPENSGNIVSEEKLDISEEQNNNTKESAEKTSADISRSSIINYINENIEDLAPSAPSAGIWKVNRFWFTDDKNVYVEYSSSGELKQILVSVNSDTDNPAYTRKAAFDSGESSWVITEGQDSEFGKDRELYEKIEEEWVKKN